MRRVAKDVQATIRCVSGNPFTEVHRPVRVPIAVGSQNRDAELRHGETVIDECLIADERESDIQRRLPSGMLKQGGDAAVLRKQRVREEVMLLTWPAGLQPIDVLGEFLFGECEVKVISTTQPQGAIEQNDAAHPRRLVCHAGQHGGAAHGPAHEGRVVNIKQIEDLAEISCEELEVVGAVGLVGLSGATLVKGDDSVISRQSQHSLIEESMGLLPSVHEHHERP